MDMVTREEGSPTLWHLTWLFSWGSNRGCRAGPRGSGRHCQPLDASNWQKPSVSPGHHPKPDFPTMGYSWNQHKAVGIMANPGYHLIQTTSDRDSGAAFPVRQTIRPLQQVSGGFEPFLIFFVLLVSYWEWWWLAKGEALLLPFQTGTGELIFRQAGVQWAFLPARAYT